MNDYHFVRKLGKGSYGSVSLLKRYRGVKVHSQHLCRWVMAPRPIAPDQPGEFVACKSIKIGKSARKRSAYNEREILGILNHAYISKFFGYDYTLHPQKMNLYLEYCPRGSLCDLIEQFQRDAKFIPALKIWTYLHQLTSALNYCHYGLRPTVVLHRDLKPDNVLVDDNGNLRICDFGLSILTSTYRLPCTSMTPTTAEYSAPEVYEHGTYDRSADIWALGCIVHELCTLEITFYDPSLVAVKHMILNNNRTSAIDSVYGGLISAVDSMLRLDPMTRPSARTLRGLAQNNMQSLARPAHHTRGHGGRRYGIPDASEMRPIARDHPRRDGPVIPCTPQVPSWAWEHGHGHRRQLQSTVMRGAGAPSSAWHPSTRLQSQAPPEYWRPRRQA